MRCASFSVSARYMNGFESVLRIAQRFTERKRVREIRLIRRGTNPLKYREVLIEIR